MNERLPLRESSSHAFVELYSGLTHRQFGDAGLFPGGQTLQFDLLKPGTDGDVPLVVFVKGGGLLNNHRSRYLPALVDLAEAGVAVASVEYRTSNQTGFAGSLDDVVHAVHYLRAHAGQLGIDPERVALWGNSAGATLAVLAASTLPDGTVSAVAGWYGVYDPAADQRYLEPDSPMRLSLGDPADGGWFRPSSFVRPGMPPVQLIHGTDDATVDCAQSQALAEELARQGVPHDLLIVDGGTHSFAQFCTRTDALARTREFLLAHLTGSR
ncbi:hypothetical protein GCM10017576_15310 [Microbacterium barkeri]|uniref:BD-FAE-like domain-containing protein n=1 Tax=Microbacterium barkeri TaxID=33917 RepID=A0A9W6H334_9MICO|nr:alpha/beta hydrolase [Microbacterium barkeri]MDI6943397.1 alpha/beta hydrolase [Microbacterium barkeri]MDR6878212.1 acetyl esterase/lipase [Microbacterium barkeri]GLJ61402.1 hypothetical protein GCM10017576_15310 [Microbacterium barkeri]